MITVAMNQLPSTVREKQLAAFIKRGFPTRREEQWKYTDTTELAKYELARATQNTAIPVWKNELSPCHLVFVNGYYQPALSKIDALPKEVVLCSLSQALMTHEETVKPYLSTEFNAQQYPFASLNTALMTDGVFLYIPKNAVITSPIHCVFLSTEQNECVIAPRNIILAGANSQAALLEEFVSVNSGDYFTNTVTMIHAEENAHLDYYKIQAESLQASHMANLFITQKRDSVIKSFCLSTGGRLVREDIHAGLVEHNAACYLNGFYYTTADNQHIDTHLYVDHVAPHSVSEMVYKGILDKKSRAVFNGKVYVHENAPHISAHQENHNLLLSSQAEINTKPELEIYTDDVKCTHGATVGQLDDDALFYLRTRGIEKDEARELLAHAFAVDVLSKIENVTIRNYMQQRVGYDVN